MAHFTVHCLTRCYEKWHTQIREMAHTDTRNGTLHDPLFNTQIREMAHFTFHCLTHIYKKWHTSRSIVLMFNSQNNKCIQAKCCLFLFTFKYYLFALVPWNFLLKCLYQARKVCDHVFLSGRDVAFASFCNFFYCILELFRQCGIFSHLISNTK